jgi:putative ABC transport system permease protein
VNIELQGAAYEKVAHEFGSVSGVSHVSATDIVPATGTNNNMQIRKAGTDAEYTTAGVLLTDEKFAGTLGVKVVAGEGLPAAGSGSDRYVLVNEETVRKMGYPDPSAIVGEVFELKWGGETLEVVGVVEDFRYKLLINSHEIGPLVMRNQPVHFQFVNVKISSPDLMATLQKLEEKWERIDPIHPFKYEFYDDQLASTHQGIMDGVTILGFIAFLAVTIACLGLLGMATYTAERRKKEVGIRKVLGAGDFSIAVLLSKEFLAMLVVSICVSAPLSYLINNLWLQQLPNRVEFGFGTVFISTLILLVLGFVTIGSQTLMAAKDKPLDALKAE